MARKAARSVVIAVTSDLHCGSTVALCPPVIHLDDGGEYRASKAQLWLWDNWRDFWGRVDAQRKALNASLYQVYNGDMTEGDHHKTTQILSGNPTAQATVVNEVMRVPLALKPEGIVMVRGTEAHVGASACYEERIASGLRKDGYKVLMDDATGNASHWHFEMDVQGVRFDFAHHGRVGARPWTKPNAVHALAMEIFYNAAANARPFPHLAVRSHMHQYVDTHDSHPTRLIQMPAWQLATAFIHRIAPNALADVGGLIITVTEGEMTVEPVRYRPAQPPMRSIA
jgi:hypothetical protein